MKKIDLSNLELGIKTTEELVEIRTQVEASLKMLQTTRPYRFYLAAWVGFSFAVLMLSICLFVPPPAERLWMLYASNAFCFVLGLIAAHFYFRAKWDFYYRTTKMEILLRDIDNQMSLDSA